MTIKALHNQTLLDLAIQQYGSAEAVVSMAISNNISITEDIEVGNKISTEQENISNQPIAQYFQSNRLYPATALEQAVDIIVPVEIGIGNMKIGSTFKIK